MNLAIIVLSLLAIVAQALRSPVVQINDTYESNLKKLIESKGEAYILFHADWCGACQRYKPLYQDFAEKMVEDYPNVNIFAVENDANPRIVSRFQIAYLPTLYHIRDGLVKNISDQFIDLDGYVKERKWEQISPIKRFLHPYSTVGDILAFIGVAGYALLNYVEALSKLTGINSSVYVMALIVVFFLSFYMISLIFIHKRHQAIYNARQKTADQHQKKD